MFYYRIYRDKERYFEKDYNEYNIYYNYRK